MRRLVFFFKQKTAYEMRISDWSSDVCSSDLAYADGDDAQCVYMRRVAVGADQGVGKGHAIAGMNDGRHAFQIDLEIGRASCRERVCQYVLISVVAVSLKKTIKYTQFYLSLLALTALNTYNITNTITQT